MCFRSSMKREDDWLFSSSSSSVCLKEKESKKKRKKNIWIEVTKKKWRARLGGLPAIRRIAQVYRQKKVFLKGEKRKERRLEEKVEKTDGDARPPLTREKEEEEGSRDCMAKFSC